MEHGAGLNSCEILDQDLVFLQAVGRQGHGNRGSQWGSLRDANDQDCDTDNDDLGVDVESDEEGVSPIDKEENCQVDELEKDDKRCDGDGILGDLSDSFIELLFQEG